MQRNAGIKFLKIYSESVEGQIYYLWELSNDDFEDGGEWWPAQVSFNANRVLKLKNLICKNLLLVLASVSS